VDVLVEVHLDCWVVGEMCERAVPVQLFIAPAAD
jgi:hypothetical protein